MKHFRLIYCLLAIIMVLTSLCGCSSDDGEPVPPPSKNDISRTVLAYIVATNSLNGADNDDIEQMQKAVDNGALGPGCSMLVYRATYNATPQLLRLTPGHTPLVLKDYGDDVNSLDPGFMSGVINDAIRLAPADDYGLILWSHSTGWLGIEQPQQSAARSFGDDHGRKIPIPVLAEALKSVTRLAFIYFDSCFMGNVESLYELRDAADWIVASPAETPFDGAPYDVSLQALFSKIPDGLEDCARLAYEHYSGQPSEVLQSSTMSVYRMSEAETLATATRQIIGTTQPLQSVASIQQYGFARRGAYFPDRFFDMKDYLEARAAESSQWLSLTAAYDNFVYAAFSTPRMWGEYSLDRANGLSIFPYDELSATGDRYSYTGLDWYERIYSTFP